MSLFALLALVAFVSAQDSVIVNEPPVPPEPVATPGPNPAQLETIIRGIDQLFSQITSHSELFQRFEERIREVQTSTNQAVQNSLQVLESSKEGQELSAVKTLHHEFNERNKEILTLFQAANEFNDAIHKSVLSNAQLIANVAKQLTDQRDALNAHFEKAGATLNKLKKDDSIKTLQPEIAKLQATLDQLLIQTKPKSFLDGISALLGDKNLFEQIKGFGVTLCATCENFFKSTLGGGVGLYARQFFQRCEAFVAQVPSYVSKTHGSLKDLIRQQGVPEQYAPTMATVLITLPITAFAALTVITVVRLIRAVFSFLFCILTCGCFRKRARRESNTQPQNATELNAGSEEVSPTMRQRGKSNAFRNQKPKKETA